MAARPRGSIAMAGIGGAGTNSQSDDRDSRATVTGVLQMAGWQTTLKRRRRVYSMLRVTLVIIATLTATSIAAFGEQRMISVGDRRLAVYCDGAVTDSRTVILISAASSATDWLNTVQPGIAKFTQV